MCQLFVSYLQVLASISALAPLSTALSIWRLLQPSHITSSGVCFQLWKAVSITPFCPSSRRSLSSPFRFFPSHSSAPRAPFKSWEVRKKDSNPWWPATDGGTGDSQPRCPLWWLWLLSPRSLGVLILVGVSAWLVAALSTPPARGASGAARSPPGQVARGIVRWVGWDGEAGAVRMQT